MKKPIVFSLAASLSLMALSLPTTARSEPGEVTVSPSQVDPAALKKWQDDRFGLFIHWGPVSQVGQELSWSRGLRDMTEEKYDNLYKTFNPTEFNADEWVSLAKAAGMKYIVLTAKHHDGFCLWGTKLFDYNIMHTPFKRDVVKELSEACKRQGMAFGAYYSVPDWYHPDSPYMGRGGNFKRETGDIEKYTDYLKGQLRELLTGYGPLITLWFDRPKGFDAKRGQSVIDMARSIQPSVLVNSRSGAKGDYDTPEQKVGKFDRKRAWESCMTISGHDHWGWSGPKDGVKPLKKVLQMLIECAGGDGNMLLNIGPRGDGKIDEEQAGRLKEVGEWIGKYGEGIYGTRGGPYEPGEWGAATCKGNTVYLYIFLFDDGNSIKLPALHRKIVSSKALTGGEAEVKQDGDGLTVSVPFDNQNEIATIVKLELDGPAFEIEPVKVGTAASEDSKAK